ncbi:MAG: hypothetical protein Q9210_005882 [Variospora velana]
MTGVFTGHSLTQAEQTLQGLAEDPDQLDCARRRFSVSPSFTSSNGKGPDSTLTNSPGAEVSLHMGGVSQEYLHKTHRNASRPRPQFQAQQYAERNRLVENDNQQVPIGTSYERYSYGVIKKRWQEQGIWSDQWDSETGSYNFGHKWMHEEPSPPGFGSEAIIDAEDENACNQFRVPRPPKRRKKDELTIEQREVRQRKPENSRPIHQFLWQVAHERERITGEPTVREVAASADLDINTKAYENVKEWWVACHIWDTKWGILPGMTWKHERPLEWPPRDDPETAPEVVYPNLVSGNGGEADPISLKSVHSSPEPPSIIMAWSYGTLPAPMPQLCHSCQWKRDPSCKECWVEYPGFGAGAGVNAQGGRSAAQAAPRAREVFFADPFTNTQLKPDEDVLHKDQPEDVGMIGMIVDSQPHPPSQSNGDLSTERPQKRARGRPKKTPNGVAANIKPEVSPAPIGVSRTSKPHMKSTRGRGRPKKNTEGHESRDKAALSAPEQATIPASRRSKRAR